jgi:hypothetical protein
MSILRNVGDTAGRAVAPAPAKPSGRSAPPDGVGDLAGVRLADGMTEDPAEGGHDGSDRWLPSARAGWRALQDRHGHEGDQRAERGPAAVAEDSRGEVMKTRQPRHTVGAAELVVQRGGPAPAGSSCNRAPRTQDGPRCREHPATRPDRDRVSCDDRGLAKPRGRGPRRAVRTVRRGHSSAPGAPVASEACSMARPPSPSPNHQIPSAQASDPTIAGLTRRGSRNPTPGRTEPGRARRSAVLGARR